MTTVSIACIVEGHGEREAVPILIRRIADEQQIRVPIVLPQPQRIPRSKLIKAEELERAVELASRRAGAILIVLDNDGDCPATLGPHLLQRARQVRADRPISVVVAKQEYEAWFLAAAESLRGRRGLPADLDGPGDPEDIRDAKGWLGAKMSGGHYVPTLDQPALTAVFDLHKARRTDSFDKLWREVVRLLKALEAGGG